ncbi:hypothetical protein D9Q98_001167 [Chlorella vulgaris]|uniref:Uncharacterized protein n=1 Tax=Chlorella vulgaris TaxID=3077 RepID=A0A9D4TZP4_CHLVU|nr:hypothetical protein D9Q98_001167 [Chlorella vulgaris]
MAVALLLAALAAAPVAAGRGFFNQIETSNADLCILYKGVECALHPECVTCHASVGSIDVCMETAIAIKLPTQLFTCDFPSPPFPPDEQPDSDEPNTDCQSKLDESSCAATQKCVWCLSAAVPSACYQDDEARRLPPAVFQCKFPGLVTSQ